MYCLCLAFALLYICLPLSWLCLSPCLCLLFVFSSLRLSWLSLCPCLCLVFSCLVLSLSCLVLSCLVLSCLVCSLCRLGGSFGVIFGRLGGRFAPRGVVLGCSWEVLWVLKRSWGELTLKKGPTQKSLALLSRFLDPSWVPKRGQDGAQNDPKSIKKSS